MKKFHKTFLTTPLLNVMVRIWSMAPISYQKKINIEALFLGYQEAEQYCKKSVKDHNVSDQNPLIQLANLIHWEEIAAIVLPDLQNTAVKGFWFLGRRLYLRIHSKKVSNRRQWYLASGQSKGSGCGPPWPRVIDRFWDAISIKFNENWRSKFN